MKGHKGNVVAYFYWDDSNDTPLKDFDNRYYTVDGKVSACDNTKITPAYDTTSYNDWVIFMPYNQFHISSSGTHKLKFFIVVWDDTINKEIIKSGWQYITYSL